MASIHGRSLSIPSKVRNMTLTNLGRISLITPVNGGMFDQQRLGNFSLIHILLFAHLLFGNDASFKLFSEIYCNLMQENPKGAAFERKTNGELVFIDSSTPKWLQEKLESMTINLKPELKHTISIHVLAISLYSYFVVIG